MHIFKSNVLIQVLVSSTFRTSCVHRQEDHLYILPPVRLLI